MKKIVIAASAKFQEEIACYMEIKNFIKFGWTEIFDKENRM